MKFIASKNLANCLVLFITVYLIFAMFWSTGRLLESPILLVVGVLFFINLLMCTIKQAYGRPRGQRLGLFILHLGLLTLLMGVGINYLWGGQGYLYLGVGQETPLGSSNLKSWQGSYFLKQWDSGYTVKLLNVQIEMKDKDVYLKSGTIQYKSRQGEVRQNTVNFVQPLDLYNARLWVNERGFAPVLDWGNLLDHWGFQTIRRGEKEVYREKLERYGYKLNGEYFPGGRDGKQGRLRLIVQDSSKPKTYYLKQGESFNVGKQKVVWQDTDYWLVLNVKTEPGLSFIWIGTALIVFGSTGYYLPLLWKRERNV